MNEALIVPPDTGVAVSAGGPNAASDLPSNFAFVMNISGLAGAASFTLAPGHDLRRASAEEVSAIREVLNGMTGPAIVPASMPWEYRRASGGQTEPMPETDWRYFVISFQGTNHTFLELEQAFSIAPLELKIGFTVLRHSGGRGLMWHAGRLFQLLDNAWWSLAFLEVTTRDVEEIAAIHSRLRQHDQHLVDVSRLLRQLQDLDAVPRHSPLQFLGHFAVLEALLTHPPKPTDPYDSITRQVKKKLALLDHRTVPNIDYSLFGEANRETVWARMYAYRSTLAHGGAPTFEGDLQLLGSHDNALKLVKQTTKAVIRQALIEPQLLADLRDC